MTYDESVHPGEATGPDRGAHRVPEHRPGGSGSRTDPWGDGDRWSGPEPGRWSGTDAGRWSGADAGRWSGTDADRWSETGTGRWSEAGTARWDRSPPGDRWGGERSTSAWLTGEHLTVDPPAEAGQADRSTPGGTGTTASGSGAGGTAAPTGSRSIPASVLDDVFDDPQHGDPGRDRLAVHLLWELVLLAAVGVFVYLLYRQQPDLLNRAELAPLLVAAAALGLLTLGAGLSLRTGAPNLALGPVAVAVACYVAGQQGRGIGAVLGSAALAVAGLGLLLALVVVGFHVPAWAASLAAALALLGTFDLWAAPIRTELWYDPEPHAYTLFGGWAALAVLGGVFGAIKPIRRSMGRFRPVADPARRRGGLAAVLTTAALVASMIYAMLAGVLLTVPTTEPAAAGVLSLEWTGLAMGAALLGGTSAFGRRGGVLGTLLAVSLLTVLFRWLEERDVSVSRFVVAAAAITLGLVVTRLVESYGRPRSASEAIEEWAEERVDPTSGGWTPPRSRAPESWTEGPPIQPVQRRTDPWDSGQWRLPDH